MKMFLLSNFAQIFKPKILESDGILRVGGHLLKTKFPFSVKYPILLPKSHDASLAILKHYHEKSFHQGRLITRGALVDAGYYLIGGRQIIKKFLANCVICRKLRASSETQMMADLPSDRVETAAPFSNTGVDVCGPWTIYDGKSTRNRTGTKKVWVVLFTCLTSRAIHVESLSSLDTPTFINSLRRFIAIRGRCL